MLGLRCCVDFSLVAGYSSGGVQGSHCGGLSWCRAQAHELQCCGRRAQQCGSQALEHRLNSCGIQALLLCCMWDPPRPGIKLLSLALAGGSFTTEPPGNPHMFLYHIQFLSSCPAQNFIVRQSTTISLPIKCVSPGLLS